MIGYLKSLFSKQPAVDSATPVEPVATEPSADGTVYKVPFTTILNISPHSNAERLELATIYGFQVIVQKGKYQIGDKVVYVPIDSLLPQWLEDKLFAYVKNEKGELVPPKIVLHHHRVRQIKIRGLASQGMLINPEDLSEKIDPDNLDDIVLDTNLAPVLGITKYEPPQRGASFTQGQPKNRNKKHEHPLFHKYNGVDNIKWFPTMFSESDDVTIQEKMHGTNARASILPFMANTWKKKLLKLFFLAPKAELCYGSNNVDISAATEYKGFYGEDVYGACFDSIDVFDKLETGELVYGEIVGPGIQTNYSYGLKEHRFLVFDVKVLQPDGKFKWLNPQEVEDFCKVRGFDLVPILYKGPYNRDKIYDLTKGPSIYDPATKVREGVVVKASENYDCQGNKRALKWVSEAYLDDKKNSDFH